MQYLTNYYKNLCEQLQHQVNVLQAQLNEGPFDDVLNKLNPKKLTDAPEYIIPDRKRGENNLTPRPIRPEEYNTIKGEISKRFKNDKLRPMNTLKPDLPYSERAGEEAKPSSDLPYSERTGESEEDSSVPSNETKRPKIDPGKIFNIDDKEKRGTEWAPKPWLRPDYVPPKFDPKAHEEMNRAFKPKDRERTPYIQKYGREDAIDSIDPKYSNNNLMDRAVSEINKKKPAGSKAGELAQKYITQKATSNSSMFNIGPGK
jgi:hypothetical protein